jgi:replication-associated recombination protein RarA
MIKPLAEVLRPQTLEDYIGQEHLIGEGAILHRAIKENNVPSMIFRAFFYLSCLRLELLLLLS